jgi:hypothetical protein
MMNGSTTLYSNLNLKFGKDDDLKFEVVKVELGNN